jgi:hypothetical protein
MNHVQSRRRTGMKNEEKQRRGEEGQQRRGEEKKQRKAEEGRVKSKLREFTRLSPWLLLRFFGKFTA